MLTKKNATKWSMILAGSFLFYKGYSFPAELTKELVLGHAEPRIAQIVGVMMIVFGMLMQENK